MEIRYIKQIRKFTALFAAILFISCSGNKVLLANENSIRFQEITQQFHGGHLEQKFMLINSHAELKRVYTQLNITRKPGLPIPAVNFNKESIIVLFMGQQNSGGYSIRIESLEPQNNETVRVLFKKTVPEGMTTMALTQPYSIYKIHKRLEKVTFVNIDSLK